MPVNTYSFQNQVRDLQEGISMIINDEPTLLGLIGLNGAPLHQTKFEWMSDALNSNRANLAANLDAVATTFNVISGDGQKFRINSLLVIDDEYMKVTNVVGDAITVVRGFDGTTVAAHTAAASDLRIVARPQLESAGVGQDESHDRYVDYNVTQIFERYASVSNTQQAVRTYNVDNELDYQVQLRLKELAREFNDALIYGRRFDAGSGQPRMTGGLLNFASIKGSVKQNLAGGEVTGKVLNDALEQVYQRGGNVNTILTNTAGARQISKLLNNQIQIQREDTTRGGYVATFVSDIVGGDMATIVVDKNMPKDKVVLFDRNILSMSPLSGRAVYDTDATTPGADFVARQIRGEYGVKVMNAKEKIAVLENVSKSVS